MSTRAAQRLAARRDVPAELRTAQWDRVPHWIRERSFFMASVDKAEVLDAFHREATAIASGDRSAPEARKRLRSMLAEIDYGPQPGQEHTIKDLRTFRRMQVSLETNVAMARGYAAHARQQKAKGVFPAQRLVRLEPRKDERDWSARWREAGGGSEPGTSGDMAALIDHPIWTALSRFGNPYPPFDFNSGMGVLPVRRDEAETLGIFDGLDPDETRAALTPRAPSPDENLELRPQVTSQTLRNALAEHLQGFAKWDGDRLVFTDPNGTRRVTANGLAEIWERGLPADKRTGQPWPLLQRDAFMEWVADSRKFRDSNATDKWEDLQRLLGRLENERHPDALWRGMRMHETEANQFLRSVESNGYAVLPQNAGDSFSDSRKAAERFASTGGGGWSVVLEMPSPDSRAVKDISPLVRASRESIAKQSQPPVQTESEWILRPGFTLSAGKIRRDPRARRIEITLQKEEAFR